MCSEFLWFQNVSGIVPPLWNSWLEQDLNMSPAATAPSTSKSSCTTWPKACRLRASRLSAPSVLIGCNISFAVTIGSSKSCIIASLHSQACHLESLLYRLEWKCQYVWLSTPDRPNLPFGSSKRMLALPADIILECINWRRNNYGNGIIMRCTIQLMWKLFN